VVLALAPALAAAVVIVNFPWARPAGKGGATEVFMELTSADGGALVGARSASAGGARILGPGTRPTTIARLPLPAGAPVVLAPGSYRIALSALDRALKLGDAVPLVVIIEGADSSRQEIVVRAEVRRRSTVDDHLEQHRH
jgi:copper(I)-binding protein